MPKSGDFSLEGFLGTVKLMYHDHSQNPKCAAVVGRWSLFFKVSFTPQKIKIGPQNSRYLKVIVELIESILILGHPEMTSLTF